jgi:hypothetical protein
VGLWLGNFYAQDLARNFVLLLFYTTQRGCNILKMKRVGRPIGEEADRALRLKLSRKKENENLTNNEGLAIVQMCQILSMCRCGVS